MPGIPIRCAVSVTSWEERLFPRGPPEVTLLISAHTPSVLWPMSSAGRARMLMMWVQIQGKLLCG